MIDFLNEFDLVPIKTSAIGDCAFCAPWLCFGYRFGICTPETNQTYNSFVQEQMVSYRSTVSSMLQKEEVVDGYQLTRENVKKLHNYMSEAIYSTMITMFKKPIIVFHTNTVVSVYDFKPETKTFLASKNDEGLIEKPGYISVCHYDDKGCMENYYIAKSDFKKKLVDEDSDALWVCYNKEHYMGLRKK